MFAASDAAGRGRGGLRGGRRAVRFFRAVNIPRAS